MRTVILNHFYAVHKYRRYHHFTSYRYFYTRSHNVEAMDRANTQYLTPWMNSADIRQGGGGRLIFSSTFEGRGGGLIEGKRLLERRGGAYLIWQNAVRQQNRMNKIRVTIRLLISQGSSYMPVCVTWNRLISAQTGIQPTTD